MLLSSLNKVAATIGGYDPISLDEMDKVRLMDRIDMKYILTFEKLNDILAELNNNYRSLTICENRIFGYRTGYFDTPELVMFYDHHNGKLSRYKIRHREYVESKLGFLEVKFRSNKGRTVKQRIDYRNSNNQLFDGFITEHTPYNPGILNCTVTSHFRRFTMVDKYMQERVTVDFDLAFSDNNHKIDLNDLVVIEIKQDRIDKASLIYRALKKYSIRPASISKYCVGLSLLNQIPKNNNFKEIILQINKLSHVEFS